MTKPTGPQHPRPLPEPREPGGGRWGTSCFPPGEEACITFGKVSSDERGLPAGSPGLPLPSGAAHPTPSLPLRPAPVPAGHGFRARARPPGPALGCSSLALGAVSHEAGPGHTPTTHSYPPTLGFPPLHLHPPVPLPRPADLTTAETLLREAFPPTGPPGSQDSVLDPLRLLLMPFGAGSGHHHQLGDRQHCPAPSRALSCPWT